MSLYGGQEIKQTTTNAAELRKIKKPLIEKRRRDRMNRCLNELKSLVVDPCSEESVRNAKMEKADILEKTVMYLEMLHAKIENNKMLMDNKTQSSDENDEDEMTNIDDTSYKTSPYSLQNSPSVKTGKGKFKKEEDETSDDSFSSHANLIKSFKIQLKSTKLQLQHLQKQQQIVEHVGYNNGFRKCIEDVETYFKKLENSRESNILLRSSLIDYLNFYAYEFQSKLQIEGRLFERFTQNISEKFTLKQQQNVAKIESKYDDNTRLIFALQQTQHENSPHLKQQLASPFPTPPPALQTTTNINNNSTFNNIIIKNNTYNSNNTLNNNNTLINNNNDIHYNTHNNFKRLLYNNNQSIPKISRKTSRECSYTDSHQQVPSKIQKFQTITVPWQHDTDPASKPLSNNLLPSHNSFPSHKHLPSQGFQDSDRSECLQKKRLELDQNSTFTKTSNCLEDFHCIKTLLRQANQQNNIKDNICCDIKDNICCDIKDNICCDIKDNICCDINNSIPLNWNKFKTEFNISSYHKNKLICLSFWRPWNALLT